MGSTVLAPLPTHGPRHTLLIFPGSHTDSGLVHLCVVTAVNKFKLCFTSCHLLQTATPWLLLGHRGFVPQENGPRKEVCVRSENRLRTIWRKNSRLLGAWSRRRFRLQTGRSLCTSPCRNGHACRRVRMGSSREQANSYLLQWFSPPFYLLLV